MVVVLPFTLLDTVGVGLGGGLRPCVQDGICYLRCISSCAMVELQDTPDVHVTSICTSMVSNTYALSCLDV